MDPTPTRIEDRFRFNQELTFDSDKSLIFDFSHYAALILQAIQEGLAPPKEERSGYDQVLLGEVGAYLAGDPAPRDTALRLLVLYEDLVVPNVDVHPGKLYNEFNVVRPGRSVQYQWQSEDFCEFTRSLQPLVLQHPVAQHHGITESDYEQVLNYAAREGSLWSPGQGRLGATKGIITSAILQDIRTVLLDAYEQGVPAVSNLLQHTPSTDIGETGALSRVDSDVLVKLYFDLAVYSPKPKSINEALEIRENSRVAKWRTTIREWQQRLGRGEMDVDQTKELIREANSYIEGAKFAHHIVPRWAHFAFLPIEAISAVALACGVHVPEAIHFAAGGFAGAQLYGQMVWLSVKGSKPQKFGWYMLADN